MYNGLSRIGSGTLHAAAAWHDRPRPLGDTGRQHLPGDKKQRFFVFRWPVGESGTVQVGFGALPSGGAYAWAGRPTVLGLRHGDS